ncbi:MAG: polysaccharide deacetylase family protein [Syntrophobacteraceae bacterium]|nr:polysaccharide deacetylase family protein [Syntrophobacteraceae bacterium]
MQKSSTAIMLSIDFPTQFRPRHCSALWLAPLNDWKKRLHETAERWMCSHVSSIFFRADDIGAGGRAFEALCHLFRDHQTPLAMAVVPAWLSQVRKEQLFRSAPVDEPLWGWHQHGWRHVNWQRTGKKSEFGEQRPFEKQWRDIWQGRQKMEEIFQARFIPVFTPPWNRLSPLTVKILQQLHFEGISLAGPLPRGARPPSGLTNLRVQVDLHTRKERDPEKDYLDLLEEMTSIMGRKEPVGIMIHHHRMSRFAFEFLHELLTILSHRTHFQLQGFQDILVTNDAG